MDKPKTYKIESSFRDPSGYIFKKNNELLRQINLIYKEDYDFLLSSGLYNDLVKNSYLISHKETNFAGLSPENAYKVIKPEVVPFISYPYEWCFSQLKNAALLTLKIEKKALEYKMTLKDATAYNIQFLRGQPIFIDTLSFEKYEEGTPWVAYKQFCQHFLAPLLLMSKVDIRLNKLAEIFIDGIPLDLASSLLPFRSKFSFSILSHIHLHAMSQNYFADKTVKTNKYKVSRTSTFGLIDNLESVIKKLKWKPAGSEWAEYYQITNYSSAAFKQKKMIISDFLDKIKPKVVWDSGSNNGIFSRIASDHKILTISFDVDPAAVEKNYIESLKKKETFLLPLILDLTNPSKSIGWQNKERMSFIERGPADMAFSLALIHHLAISNNLPFEKIASFYNQICKSLVVEFIPKDDSKVQKLLATRKDIFTDYTQENFEESFSQYFKIIDRKKIKGSKRILYLMVKK
ncbi:MAG: SAM-dependent methyltransferase [Patescibacteria group bacterium]|jgi:ribosomal protein L11 methylase PrmA